MKKSYIAALLLSISFSFAQENEAVFDRMVESEMKSASKLLNLAVNPNTLNYDITQQTLRFSVDPAVYFINGNVQTTFTALSNLNTVTFDLTNQLVVSSVKKNNVNLTFVQNANNELVITLPTTQLTGTSATIEIIYSGQPATGEQAFTAGNHAGTPVIYTLSEPFGARDWWPCKQDLNDKINNIDVYITAPSQYKSVSNGVEMSQTVNGNLTTTHFHHNYPIPAYLIAIAVTNYTIYNQTAGIAPNTFPIVNYIYPETFTPAVQSQLDQTPAIMNVFETLFETYPFHNEKYGHAQFGWGGGMEHTTVSFMGSFERSLIAHELGHQWFGDKITCGSWRDIWLNEGFAEYLSGLVIENLDGNASFTSWKNSKINNITSVTNGAVYLSETEATNVGRIFSSRLTYNKGAMVVNMLRFKLGDAVFFQGMRNYLADPNIAFKYAITPQLQTHLEAVYGQSLQEFFDDWIYRQGYPTYTITAQNWGTGQARIVINQTQSHFSVSFFEMPVPVRLTSTSGEIYDVVLNNTLNNQEFIIPVPFQVASIIFDPNKNIISKNNTTSLANDNFELDNAIAVYPNPTSNEIHIQIPSDVALEKCLVFNNLGQKVLETTALDFSVSSLSTGIHILQIVTSNGTFNKKIIKK